VPTEPTEVLDESDSTTRPSTPAAVRARSRGDYGSDEYIEPGTFIEETYRIQRVIGVGAMGVVALARDVRLARDVAIKLVRPGLLQMSEARRRFLSEARAMARLRHPHVVHVYALGEFRERPYLVMEYVPGMSLDRFIAERGQGPLGIDEAVGIVDQICRGVSALHAANALHRDLKPSNVLIGPGFRVVVADLGLARAIAEVDGTAPGFSGTPSYMAPEVLLGITVTGELASRADVYSLGVIAYQLLTGHLPVEGSPKELARLVTDEISPPIPSHVNRLLPKAFDGPLLDALARHPENRTASADSFRRALAAASEAERSPAAPIRVLVADDDAEYRDLIAHVLARAFPGAVIECAPDGQTAVGSAEHDRPSLVVLDLDMPGLNGIEATAALRASSRTATVPIIVASAVGGPTDWALLSRLGADGFIGKPFEPGQLVSLARGVLSQARERKH